jgi:cell filamentation protein
MTDETYCYPPDFKILRNRFNIRNEHELDLIEREFVTQRMRETIPAGQFDLAHLKSIHREFR